MIYVIAKLAENTNGYQYPSGGKFDPRAEQKEKLKPRSQPYKKYMGFGHEEWNFNRDMAVKGKILGYHYYVPSAAKQDELFTIYFVAYQGNDRWTLVGAYRNARYMLNPSRAYLPKKKALKWLADKFIELAKQGQLGSQWKGLSDDKVVARLERDVAKDRKWLVDIDDVVALPRAVVLDSKLGIENRYRRNFHETRPTEISDEDASALDTLLNSPPPMPGRAGQPVAKSDFQTDPYLRLSKAQQIVVERRERKLAEQFEKWLKSVGAKDIELESEYVDVQCTHRGKRHLFELKSCLDKRMTKYAVRSALGQVLEYSLFPGRKATDYSAVVIDQVPSNDVLTWCARLTKLGVRIELYWVEGRAFRSAGLADHSLSKAAGSGKAKGQQSP